MFKLLDQDKFPGNYIEVGQPNPLRWMLVQRTKDSDFVAKSKWIKCRDFFNDVAYTYSTGKNFLIYGFDAGTVGLVKGKPVYMALKHTTEYFISNMDVVNDWLITQDVPPVPMRKEDDLVFAKFDPFFFQKTYNISLITLIIRLVNSNTKFESFDQILAYKQFPPQDQNLWDKVVAKGKFFNLPKKYDQYIWYSTSEFNSSNDEPLSKAYGFGTMVHNNGVIGWSNGVL